ncbi:MAG: CDP-glycerol glycerophosphotransferase [Bacteroidetes bacterium]|nr:CDP-glycerol glycerophosphotransferase [Bacteroidota bacterium]
MKRFLINISHGYSVPIGKPLQDEIKERGHEVKWFSELESAKPYLTKEETLLNTVEEVMDYNPDIVLVATDAVPYFFPGIKVQIFHGFLVNKWSFKKGHFRIRGFFDLYCTQGPSTTGPFNMLKKKHKYFEVVETGWSKVDPIFRDTNKLTRINDKPTVLVSSTFTTKYSLANIPEVYEEIKRLSLIGKWQFLVILHPKMKPDIVEKFKSLESENLKYFDTTDIIPIFKIADIMFSDTTSAIPEFILQHKPVVTFRNNKPMPHLMNIEEIEDIEKSLERAFTFPKDLMKEIDSYIEFTHPYDDGKSSRRLIDATLNFLEKDRSYLKKKPLNLFRKYQMRKRLNYFKF